MRKFDLNVSRQNNLDAVKYVLGAGDVYDDRAAEKISQIPNIEPLQYIDEDGKRSIISYAHEDTTLAAVMKEKLNKKEVLCLLSGVAAAFEIGAQGVPISYIIKDVNYVYVDRESLAVKCIIVPVKQDAMPLGDIPVFFRNIISNMMFDERDTDNYVASIITDINSPDFSTGKFKQKIDEQLDKMGVVRGKDGGILSGNPPAQTQVKVNRLGVMNAMAGQPMNGQPRPMGAPMPPMNGQPRPMGAPMPPQGQPMNGQPRPMGQPMPPQGQPMNGQPRPMGQPMPPMNGQPRPMGQPMPPQGQPMPPMNGQPRPMGAPMPPQGQPMPPMNGQPRPMGQPMQPMNGQPRPQGQPVPPQGAPAPKPPVGAPVPNGAPVPPQGAPAPKPPVGAPVPPQGAPAPKPPVGAPAPQGQGALMGQLGNVSKPVPHIVRKKTGEHIYIEKPEFSIGKSKTKADYPLEDNPAISRVHCIIIQRNGVNYIKDNHSTNHTFLNGVELEPDKEMLLKHKSVIQMGDEEFMFLLRKGD